LRREILDLYTRHAGPGDLSPTLAATAQEQLLESTEDQ
jgi:hypothetical protein